MYANPTFFYKWFLYVGLDYINFITEDFSFRIMETFAREKFQKFRDTATFKVLSPFILTVYRYMVSVIKWSEIYMYSSEYLLTITKNLRYFIPCIFFTLILIFF